MTRQMLCGAIAVLACTARMAVAGPIETIFWQDFDRPSSGGVWPGANDDPTNKGDINGDGVQDFVDATGGVLVDAGIGQDHNSVGMGGNGSPNSWGATTTPAWSQGLMAVGNSGTANDSGVTVQWDDSNVDYSEPVTVSFWLSYFDNFTGGGTHGQFISGREMGIGIADGALGGGSTFFNSSGFGGGGQTDFLYATVKHDDGFGGKSIGGRSSGGGLNTSPATAGRGLFNANSDPTPGGPQTERDFIQFIIEFDRDAQQAQLFHYDPQSGDGAPVFQANLDLSNVNPMSGINQIRLAFLASVGSIPAAALNDVGAVAFSGYAIDDIKVVATVIPEPAAATLLGIASVLFAVVRRRR